MVAKEFKLHGSKLEGPCAAVKKAGKNGMFGRNVARDIRRRFGLLHPDQVSWPLICIVCEYYSKITYLYINNFIYIYLFISCIYLYLYIYVFLFLYTYVYFSFLYIYIYIHEIASMATAAFLHVSIQRFQPNQWVSLYRRTEVRMGLSPGWVETKTLVWINNSLGRWVKQKQFRFIYDNIPL